MKILEPAYSRCTRCLLIRWTQLLKVYFGFGNLCLGGVQLLVQIQRIVVLHWLALFHWFVDGVIRNFGIRKGYCGPDIWLFRLCVFFQLQWHFSTPERHSRRRTLIMTNLYLIVFTWPSTDYFCLLWVTCFVYWYIFGRLILFAQKVPITRRRVNCLRLF